MNRLLWIGLTCFAVASPTQAASFDCEKAATKVEKLICVNPEISSLDDDLGQVYQSTIAGANDEQKLRLEANQKHWLKHTRNICKNDSCVKQAYITQLSAIEKFSSSASAKGGDWIYRGGTNQQGPLCEDLLMRLNRYDRKESLDNRCSWNVIASYPLFSDPLWEELDSKKYEDLIAKIEKYEQETPDGYFHRLTGIRKMQPDLAYRNRAKDFIKNGGRLQVWRTKLSPFNFSNSKGNRDPSKVQTIIRMSGGYPMQPHSKELDGKLANICKGMPWVDTPGTIVFVTPDLSGPDPRVDAGTFGILSGHDLKIYEGETTLVGEESIWRDSPNGLVGYCDFEFAKGKK